MNALGKSDDFDFVVLAIGFGLERDCTQSYWRNELYGQPCRNNTLCRALET